MFYKGVKNRIRNKNNGFIRYTELTFDNIILTIKAEGLKWCNQVKRNYQIKKQKLYDKKRIKNFCEQLGYVYPVTLENYLIK